MKKLPVLAAVLLVASVAAAVFFTRQHSRLAASELVPAETILFASLPDLGRTGLRWKQTALFKILHEPEVLAFLDEPKARLKSKALGSLDSINQIREIRPGEVFFAVTGLADAPKVIAGFSYGGSAEAARALLEKPKSRLAKENRTTVQHGNIEIESFSDGKVVLANAFAGNWCLVANDLELLKSTLDRMQRKAPSLSKDPLFQKALSKVSQDPDGMVFFQPNPALDRLKRVLESAGKASDGVEALRKVEAFIGTSKIEGAQIHDTTFVLMKEGAKEEALSRGSLAFTSLDTLLYYVARLRWPSAADLDNGKALGLADSVGRLEQVLAAKGVKLEELPALIGPEAALVLDWAPVAARPSGVLVVDIGDREKVTKLADLFSQEQGAWARSEIDETTFYLSRSQIVPMVSPALAITDKFALLGIDLESVKGAVARLRGSGKPLSQSDLYSKSAAVVAPPSTVFGFLDSRALFERTYSTVRPFLLFWSGIKKGEYFDLTKLPTTEAVSKHLGPVVLSCSQKPDGLLVESVGSVTFGHAAIGLAASLAPRIKARIEDYLEALVSKGSGAVPPSAGSGTNSGL